MSIPRKGRVRKPRTRSLRENRFPCVRCGTMLNKRQPPDGRALHIACPRCRYLMFDFPRMCVGMVVVKGRDTLLLRRGHHPRRGYLDLPGGFLEPGESTEHGARRELLEETGLRVAKVNPLGIYWDRYHLRGYGYFPTMNFYYLGHWRGGEPRAADDAAGAEWVPINQLARPGRRLAWRHMREVFRDLSRRMRR